VQSGQLAENMGIAMKGLSLKVNQIHSIDRGVWILKAVNCPSLLIETGYMTNTAELSQLKSSSYQKKIASGILQGLNNFLAGVETHPFKTITDTVIVRAKDSTNNKSVVIVTDSARLDFKKNKPLIVIDGKVQPLSDLSEMDVKRIEKIEVLKNESATKLYGEAGKNGVILVTLRASAKSAPEQPIKVHDNPIPKNVVYYIDGVKVDSISAKK